MKTKKFKILTVILIGLLCFKTNAQDNFDEIRVNDGISIFIFYQNDLIKRSGTNSLEITCPKQESIISGYRIRVTSLQSPYGTVTINGTNPKKIDISTSGDEPDWPSDEEFKHFIELVPVYSISDSLFSRENPRISAFRVPLKLKRNEPPTTNYESGFKRIMMGNPDNNSLTIRVKGGDNNPALIVDDNYSMGRFDLENNNEFRIDRSTGILHFSYEGALGTKGKTFTTSVLYTDWENKTVSIPVTVELKPDNNIAPTLEDIVIEELYVEGEEKSTPKIHAWDPLTRGPFPIDFANPTNDAVIRDHTFTWKPDFGTVPVGNTTVEKRFRVKTLSLGDRPTTEAWLFIKVKRATSPPAKSNVQEAKEAFESIDLIFRKNVTKDACIIANVTADLVRKKDRSVARTEMLSELGDFGIDETVLKVASLVLKWASDGGKKNLEAVNTITSNWKNNVETLTQENTKLFERLLKAQNAFISDDDAKQLLQDIIRFKRKIQTWQLATFSGDQVLAYIKKEDRRNEIRTTCIQRQTLVQ